MGNWSLNGVFLIIGVFFVVFGFILSQINVTSPYDNAEHSVLTTVFQMVNPVSCTPSASVSFNGTSANITGNINEEIK